MATEKQIEANQQNAKRSTGPKTKEGKANSRRNALKHGLLAPSLLLLDESQDTYDSFSERLWRALAPEGGLEEQLAERVISALWRLLRVPKIEAGMLQEESYVTRFNQITTAFCIHDTNITNLMRYETTLERSAFKAMRELQRLQALRRPSPVATSAEYLPVLTAP